MDSQVVFQAKTQANCELNWAPGDRRGSRPRVHLHRQRPLHRAPDAARLQGQAGLRGAAHAQPGTTTKLIIAAVAGLLFAVLLFA